MAFIPVNNGATFALRGDLYGQPWVNTLSFTTSGAWDADTLTGFAIELEVWWAAQIAPQLSSDLVLRNIYGLSLESATAPSIVHGVTGGGIAGAKANPALPGKDCLCVSFRTSARGRSGRGRNYVSGLTELDVTGNTVSEAVADGLREGYLLLIDAADIQGHIWSVFQKHSNGAPLPLGVPRAVRDVVIVDRNVDNQRGRSAP